ncbi:TetR/AcrR family transcriptional regulator [Pseudonocardia nigra]|uniref:TetR/AcrR family transcriptional regulator n=1 Tax=Pseudonocardia nigra TaxID=1921578 RepID=UPI001C600923|nr:TetR/AcrR family transcriptional regulator [Pseudonocardia nigra]
MTTQPAPESGTGATEARPRDSAATRRALLTAARHLFATVGYDATTVRAIADRAGVNQALLFRYFGNKEGVFAEAVMGDAMQLLADGPRPDLLEHTLAGILADEGGQGAETLMAVLRATGSAQVAEEVRSRLGAAYSSAFAALVDTDDPTDATVRADLLLAWLLGIVLMRSVLRPGPLQDAEAVTEHVLRAAHTLLGRQPRP